MVKICNNQFFYKHEHASGVLLVFDLTNHQSFENLPHWIKEFGFSSTKEPRNIPILLIGNKLDLRGQPEHECIPTEIGMKYSDDLSNWSHLDIPYYETSALVGLNIDTAFRALIDLIDARITISK